MQGDAFGVKILDLLQALRTVFYAGAKVTDDDRKASFVAGQHWIESLIDLRIDVSIEVGRRSLFFGCGRLRLAGAFAGRSARVRPVR